MKSQISQTIVSDVANVGPKETVVVVSDQENRSSAKELVESFNDEISADRICINGLSADGENPSELSSETLSAYDIAILVTYWSITHTKPVFEARETDTRIISMPRFSDKTFTAMDTSYGQIVRHTERLANIFDGTTQITVSDTSGTNIKFDIGDRPWVVEQGVAREPGWLTNLPAGEIAVAPDSATGKIVVEGTIAALPDTETNSTINVVDGEVVNTDNNQLASILQETPCARKIAELGFGANPDASLIGHPVQDEKVLGTAHIGFGSNTALMGNHKCSRHFDAVLTEPNVVSSGAEVDLTD